MRTIRQSRTPPVPLAEKRIYGRAALCGAVMSQSRSISLASTRDPRQRTNAARRHEMRRRCPSCNTPRRRMRPVTQCRSRRSIIPRSHSSHDALASPEASPPPAMQSHPRAMRHRIMAEHRARRRAACDTRVRPTIAAASHDAHQRVTHAASPIDQCPATPPRRVTARFVRSCRSQDAAPVFRRSFMTYPRVLCLMMKSACMIFFFDWYECFFFRQKTKTLFRACWLVHLC